MDFYKQELDISLFHIYSGTTPTRPETRDLIFSNVGDFEKIENPEFGDIIILKIFGIECHIAVFIGEGKMLHTSNRSGSVIDRVSKWKRQIVGFYRVRKNDKN